MTWRLKKWLRANEEKAMTRTMMERKKLIMLVSGLALATVVIGALFSFSLGVMNNNNNAAGPSDEQQQQPPLPPSRWQPGENNGRLPAMNISKEEMQQMMEARMQTAITACQDKAEGDACTMTAGDSKGNMAGTCKTQNGNLTCSIVGMTRGSNRSSVTPG